MKSNEIFSRVLAIICEECDINDAILLKSLNRDAVDARCILVCSLSELGLSDDNISAYLMMTRQGVNKLKNTYNMRSKTSYWLKSTKQLISNRIATEFLS